MKNTHSNIPAISEIHQRYLLQLKDYRTVIADFISRCERGQILAEDRAQMLKCVQDLAGASDVSGYTDVGKAAQALEDALVTQMDSKVLAPLIHALHVSCHTALTFLPSDWHQENVAPPVSGRKPTLLVVDDDRTVCEMMKAMFELDANVMVAKDGPSAFDAIQRYKPDLVLLDVMMPGMTGLRLLEKLKEDTELSGTQVIMLTSIDRQQDFARAFGSGAISYITKPFNPQALAIKVRALLKHFLAQEMKTACHSGKLPG